MTAALPFRIFHQFRAEWRHHRGWIIAWLLWLLPYRSHRTQDIVDPSHAGYFSLFMMDDLVPLITLLISATITWRCISADSPSNTNCGTLTRPLGQRALWLGKLVFLTCGMVLPLLAVEMTTWTGFGQGFAAWLALIAGVLLAAMLVVGTVGAVTSLTSSTAQVIAVAVLGVLGAGVWMTLGLTYSLMASPTTAGHVSGAGGGLVAAMVAGLGTMAAWWLATVPRRRSWAAVLLLVSLLQAPWVSAAWKADWVTPLPPSYPVGRLGVKTGRADPADKTPGRALWPTLRITGLGKDEVASIIDFAPVLDDGKPWPPLGSHSDLIRDTAGDYETWLHLDHLRAVLRHSPPTTLWQHAMNNQIMYNGRPTIQEVIRPLRLDPQAMPARWRLRLAVHQMRRVATLPCEQLWSRPSTVILRPGLRLELNPCMPLGGQWQITGRVHDMHPRLPRPQAAAPAISQGAPLGDGVLLVFEDPELRENTAYSIGLQRVQQQPALQVDVSRAFYLILQESAAQQTILKTTHQDWVSRSNATLWYAEERGTVDLELTREQMAEVLAPPPKPAGAAAAR